MNRKYLKYIQQNRKKIGISVVIIVFLILLGVTLLPNKLSKNPITPSNKTVYVAVNSSGDFNCDGSDDQVEINKALAYVAENPQFTTVHLKGPNTYIISDNIFIGNNTTLEGDPTSVIKLEDKADWPLGKSLITQMDKAGNHNITIKGFKIDGNHNNNTDKNRGYGYYDMIHFFNSKNIKIYGMYMQYGHGDGLRVEKSSNIQFYNNRVFKLGHDGLYAIGCQNVEARNNKITCRTNSGLRIWDSNHVKFHDNVIDSFYHWSAGSSGIQIEKSTGIVNDVEVYNNTIHNTYGPGIWLIGYGESYPKGEAENVHIHDNIFYNTGTNPSIDWVGGIVTSGFYDTLIENNVFDGVYHAAIIHMYPTGESYPVDLSPKGKGYTTIVRNNIIANTQKRKTDPDGTGYGVINYLPETHTFVLENNCLYNNMGGNYKNANPTTDVYMNPLFVDQKNHDYRLISNVQREQRTKIRALLRFEKINTGIKWFETKWSITKNAVNQFLTKQYPSYIKYGKYAKLPVKQATLQILVFMSTDLLQ